MKKLVSLLLMVCMCLPIGIILMACDEAHTHTLTKVEAVVATCETTGNSEYYSCDCGKYFSDAEGTTEITKDSWVIPETGHGYANLTKVEAVAATCETTGNSEYYFCDCGKYFSDADGTTEIAKDSWVIPETGHSYTNTWTHNETHHWKEATCSHSTEKGEYAEHSLINNECACGYVAVTYTVADVNAWNEVFTGDYLTNGTVNIENNSYQNNVIMPDETNGVVMKSNETAMVMIMSAQGQTQAQYLVKSGETWYGLSEVSGAWYGREMTAEQVVRYTFAGSNGNIFVDKFTSFEYDGENHCYVAENFDLDGSTTADYVKVYIENGKLVAMEIKVTYATDMYGISSYVFSDYGTTTIEVPAWTPAPQQ